MTRKTFTQLTSQADQATAARGIERGAVGSYVVVMSRGDDGAATYQLCEVASDDGEHERSLAVPSAQKFRAVSRCVHGYRSQRMR